MKSLILSLAMSLLFTAAHAQQMFYQLKKYEIANPQQETILDNYFKNAFIPAAHKLGIKHVGVFKPSALDAVNSGKAIYLFLPFKSLADFEKFSSALLKDKEYLKNGEEYLNAPYNNPPYVRIVSTLMKAFHSAPTYQLPKLATNKSERIYELRSYEGHTEKISQNKIKQFNSGSQKAKSEVAIFDRLGFNAVFYGDVISGPSQPNMVYMTTFENKADRDRHWDSFRVDSEWAVLKAEPEYQNNVLNNIQLLLTPTDYSDI